MSCISHSSTVLAARRPWAELSPRLCAELLVLLVHVGGAHLVVDGEVFPGSSLLSADVLVELEGGVGPPVDT